MAQAAQKNRELFIRDGLSGEHPTERDLCGSDQVELRVLDAVDLSFGTSWSEADPLQDGGQGKIGSGDRREPSIGQQADRILLEGKSRRTAAFLR